MNSGNMVTIPAEEVTIGNWTGTGYIMMDASGAGSYMISGGLNGGEVPMELATLVIASSIVSVTGTVELIAALISSIFVSIFPVATVVACVALALIVTVWMVDMYCSYYDYIYTGNLESYVDTQDKAFQLFILGDFELIMSQFIFANYPARYLKKTGGATGESGSKTGTVWDNITSTADNIPATEIPATFKIDLDGNINYVNPATGTNTLWTNSNATKHMGEYISRFGEESWSIGARSQAMLESYSASLNKAMETISTQTPGRHFGTYGNWELGINTETGIVYHARMINWEGDKMKFEKVFNNKKYVRKIESMGEGIVLFEISVVDKRVGQNYHFFCEDKRKPPLDIAINPDDGMIEYISYFAQDEMINNISAIPVIINEDMGISICNKEFNEDNMNVTVDGRFKFWKSENTILILKDDIEEFVLNAYKINDLNNILFLGNDFVGIEFKNLNQEEILEIHNSKCLL